MTDPVVLAHHGRTPDVERAAFVAPGAAVIGDVVLGEGSSIWYGTVVRGDRERIVVGAGSNLQDLTVVHADPGFPATIGERVSVGHRAIIHGCTIGDDVLIGMGAIVMDGAVVGSGSLIAAGALVTQGKVIPEGSLVAGVPGRIVRAVTDEEAAMIRGNAPNYVALANSHREALER